MWFIEKYNLKKMYEEFLCYNEWFECVLRNFLYFDILKNSRLD